MSPSVYPTVAPSAVPTVVPSAVPTVLPSVAPSAMPSVVPTFSPTRLPTLSPTEAPSVLPSQSPSQAPVLGPSRGPTVSPSATPSVVPTLRPSVLPSVVPTSDPTLYPTLPPTVMPTVAPSLQPSVQPSVGPTLQPSAAPTMLPSAHPTLLPSLNPTIEPSTVPSLLPSLMPSLLPTVDPSIVPTMSPSAAPTKNPSVTPSRAPSVSPSTEPSLIPSVVPTVSPSVGPSVPPSAAPSIGPSVIPSQHPSIEPSVDPTLSPSVAPSVLPSWCSHYPTVAPSLIPSVRPSCLPSLCPSVAPSIAPSVSPTLVPSSSPSIVPSTYPSMRPSVGPTMLPSLVPSGSPSKEPTIDPTLTPSSCPTDSPSVVPSVGPTLAPSRCPSTLPTEIPSIAPSVVPSFDPTVFPTVTPSVGPTLLPSAPPSRGPTLIPTGSPTTMTPTVVPSTVEYYVSHPKATLPSNQSISVIGPGSINFKIVLPFGALLSGPNGTVFDDVVLSVDESFVSSLIGGSSSSTTPLDISNRAKYVGSGGWDKLRRSAAKLRDINGDGYDDFIIGDPFASKCFVMFGTRLGLTSMVSGFTIFGESEGGLTGWSVSGAGDVNNDTLHDIIVGAPAVKGVGAFYVIYGRRFNNFDVYLSNFTSTQGYVMYGEHSSDFLGISVSNAGDVNGDQYDDVIVGALMTATYFSGAAYVVYGGRSRRSLSSISSLKEEEGFTAVGTSYSFCGYAVSNAGDVNGDGLDDVLIGSSPRRSSLVPTAYIVYGTKTVFDFELSLISLTSSQGARLVGGGEIVQGGGDVNQDGFADILVYGGPSISTTSVGYLIYSNVSCMTERFAPTPMPTSTRPPSNFPVAPSVRPSRMPSAVPSVRPSAPSVEPTTRDILEDWPSVAPTEVPSEFPTEVPSEAPSESPSRAPSVCPSVEPTKEPSIRPSEAPSTVEPTLSKGSRSPFSIPTVVPSVLSSSTTVQRIVDSGTVYDYTGFQNYVVNASGVVIITNEMGFNTYTLSPRAGATVVITHFNSSNDQIDLTAFASITSYRQLVIMNGSVIVSLPNEQIIHILNLHPEDVSERNFVLNKDKNNDNKTIDSSGSNGFSVVAGCLVGIGGLIVGAMMLSRLAEAGVIRMKSFAAVPKDHFLLELRYTKEGVLLDDDGKYVDGEQCESDSTRLSGHTLNSKGEWMEKDEERNQHNMSVNEHELDWQANQYWTDDYQHHFPQWHVDDGYWIPHFPADTNFEQEGEWFEAMEEGLHCGPDYYDAHYHNPPCMDEGKELDAHEEVEQRFEDLDYNTYQRLFVSDTDGE